ncbi:MAG: L-lactate permease [Bacteroides sp.]|nr:L-lactate permease [Bacteroides sp.]
MDALISLVPIVALFVLMLWVRMSGWGSALVALCITCVLGIWFSPLAFNNTVAVSSVETVGWSLAEGIVKAIYPILPIILMAIFSYNILVASGAVNVIKRQFTGFSDDKGILVLMVVWGFGGLLEGMAGFGTAVAIPASILIGLGYKPIFSALVSLLGNTMSTAFGAVGVPILTLCTEASPGGAPTSEIIREICTFSVIQLSPLYIIIPILILFLSDHNRIGRNFILGTFVGLVSLVTTFLCALYLGPETPGIISSIASIGAIIFYVKVTGENGSNVDTPSFAESLKAWSAYIITLLLILLTGPLIPSAEVWLKNHAVTIITIPCIESTFNLRWLGNSAVWLFVGSVSAGLIQGLGMMSILRQVCITIYNLRFTALTIVALIAMSSVMSHTGMINSLASGMVNISGRMYPFFAPLVGAIGTFVTGSFTSSNILFGHLQYQVATMSGLGDLDGHFLGMHGNGANWLVAANTTGATGGKLISPQSIAIATAACDMKDADDIIMRKAIPFAIGYILLGGLTVFIPLCLH